MGTAGQSRLGETQLGQDAVRRRQVLGFARVGGATERQFPGFEPEMIGGAIHDQGQSLKRLGGRSPEGHQVGITRLGHDSAIRTHHGYGHSMD